MVGKVESVQLWTYAFSCCGPKCGLASGAAFLISVMACKLRGGAQIILTSTTGTLAIKQFHTIVFQSQIWLSMKGDSIGASLKLLLMVVWPGPAHYHSAQ